jgi:tRNA (uracil-5-)-methyltransferase
MADEEEKEEEETTFTTTKEEEEEEEEEDTMRVVPVKVVASGGTALVRGLPSDWDERAMRKALDDMKATGHTSIKKRKGWTHAFVTFNFPSERKGCLEKLRARAAREGGKGGGGGFGKKVTMRDAKEKKDGNGKTKKTATTEAKEAVCPLWNVTYSEQLKRKKAKVKKALAMVTEMVGKTNEKFKKSTRRHHHHHHHHRDGVGDDEDERATSERFGWLKEANARKSKGCCELIGIVRSPVLEGYRNKSEFTIGNNSKGQPTIGFNVGLFREGNIAVGEPVGCRNISKAAICVQEAAQKYLRDVIGKDEELPTWDKRNGSGFWRLLIVREGGCAPSVLDDSSGTNRAAPAWRKWLRLEGEEDDVGGDIIRTTNNVCNEDAENALSLDAPTPKENSDVMVVVQINPSKEFGTEKMEKALKGIRDAMESAANAYEPKPFSITVQLRQHNELVSNMAAADAHTSELVVENGNTNKPMVIYEHMCGLKFSLSHSAFFQVNTAAAELLYALAGEWASPNGKSLLLDVCCGTGTIGLTLASSVGKVVGLDIVEDAIRNAEMNSKLNDRDNCEWVAGKAEDTLDVVLRKYGKDVRTVFGNTDEERNKEVEEEEEEKKDKQEFLYEDVVAIVDPPRCGLHKRVLNALRKETRLRKIVYVSCNPESMAQNCVELCSLKPAHLGPPFLPRKAMAVDLFPHTAHCEAVLVLER